MDTSTFSTHIGMTIRALRKARGHTQQDFAALAGLSRGTVANIETGRQAVSGHQLFQIALVLGISSLDEIFPPLASNARDNGEEIPIHRAPELGELSKKQIEQVQALTQNVR